MSEQSTERPDNLTEEDDRLKMISQSIKTMAAMAQVGVTFCIVIPGYGVREDARLVSNYITKKIERSDAEIGSEICGNIEATLEAFMKALLAQGVSDDAIMRMVDRIGRKTKEPFTVTPTGIRRAAGPQ